MQNNGRLSIVSTANQDTPLTLGMKPLLCIDVWEHAYYLKRQNERDKYVESFWHLIDWVEVAKRMN
jgi:Fe-Mn family superoxide dismutase